MLVCGVLLAEILVNKGGCTKSPERIHDSPGYTWYLGQLMLSVSPASSSSYGLEEDRHPLPNCARPLVLFSLDGFC